MRVMREQQDGSVMLMMMALVGILLIITLSTSSYISKQFHETNQAKQEEVAFHASEAGIQHVLYLLNENVYNIETLKQQTISQVVTDDIEGTLGSFQLTFSSIPDTRPGQAVHVTSIGADVAKTRCQKIDASIYRTEKEAQLFSVLNWDHQTIPCTDEIVVPDSTSTPTPTSEPPTVQLLANGEGGSVILTYNSTAVLSWTSTNATSCTASGSWSGEQVISGSYSTGAITANKIYALTCSGENGTNPVSDSVTVNVTISDLVAHWKMDEFSGTTLSSAVGSGNTASLIGSGGINRSGPAQTTVKPKLTFQNSYARDFDGTDDYARVSTLTNIPTARRARTISAWVYLDSIPDNKNSAIVSLGDSGSGQKFILQIARVGGVYYLFTDAVNGNNNIAISGSQVPSTGAWHHIAFTFNGASRYRYYLNGVQQKTGVFGTTINTIATNMSLGRRSVGAVGYFDGKMDDVRIYSKELSVGEIQHLAGGNE